MRFSIFRRAIFLAILLEFFDHSRYWAYGYVAPITINGKQFVNSINNEPFFLKGVDYQPGGSSKVNDDGDPLSDPATCARDVVLFQDLGINTVRIYSINPDLNHDKCMSMLAVAGIYVILDVNSPLQNQHLNRYEPWTTYNSAYLEHIFKIIEQFGHYNNTLGFFAGNEVINDKLSAQLSPPYVKSVIGDMKTYIKEHSPRAIPVGYSAADDLDYRVPLSSYLECAEDVSSSLSVDFYGVNSYQWCGRQTMETSGYDKLVEAYKNYTKPVFFSEFGCNKVLPRAFDEVKALFSEDMFTTFSGGLVYEFSQESNNYGLVDIDSNGTAKLLRDFTSLKSHYNTVVLPNHDQVFNAISKDDSISKKAYENETPLCMTKYDNLDVNGKVPKGLANSLIKTGVDVKKGKYVELNESDLNCELKIVDSQGNPWKGANKVKTVNDLKPYHGQNHDKDRGESSPSKGRGKAKNLASVVEVPIWSSLALLLSNVIIQLILF